MSSIVQEGANLLVAHRRLYSLNEPRFFVGRCVACAAGIVTLAGRTYLRDINTGEVTVKQDVRTKIISLSSGIQLVCELSVDVDLAAFHFRSDEGWITAVDENGFEMNLNEHPNRWPLIGFACR